jgi:hypothetical protein
VQAATQAAASALTFSGTDRLLQETGIQTAEEQAKLREYNEVADTVGTVGGTIAPLLTPAGVATAPGLIAKAGQAVERVAAKALGSAASKSLAKDVVRKSLAKGAGSAVEGAAFGAGQLLREDALGEAEVNAENLLAYAGTGALTGAALGTILPAAGAGVAAATKGAKNLGAKTFGQLAKKIADPVEDSMELLGYTPKMKARVLTEATEAKLVQDLPRWLREDVGWKTLDDEVSRLAKLQNLGKASAGEIDTILTKADDAIATKFKPEQVQAARVQLFNNVASDLESEVLERLGSINSANPARKRLESLVKNIRKYTNRISQPNQIGKVNIAKEIRQLRNTIWDTYKALPFEERGTQAGAILKNSYGKIARSLQNFVRTADDTLEAQFVKANENYSRFKKFEEPLARRAARDKHLLSFRDLIFGGVGINVGGVGGAIAAGIRKLADSDLKKKIVVLSSVEKANKQASQKGSRGWCRHPVRLAFPGEKPSTPQIDCPV